ncbi:VOC family protein [Actinomadura rupiterrae]|uniref:VOC family protein n=1 Tax=Actinomadura rupiterrae TaxID=559627 RepID=UPI0020A4E506|nr:VOC family protein [Actinomadura rupiterrae]MCP2336449.1 catechol 2,3-dioxygenase-like lactoylglutathione lyase family enzyme [Actinomadura rupiterrae]
MIDRTIYPMPMFATFRVADVKAAAAFYEAAGFVSLATVPGPDGSPAVIHLRRMKYQDLLLVPGEAVPGSTTVSFSAGDQDLAALAASLREAAFEGAHVSGPSDTPWFTSDLTIDDPDGNRIILTAPRMGEMGQAKEWAKTFEGDYEVVEQE